MHTLSSMFFSSLALAALTTTGCASREVTVSGTADAEAPLVGKLKVRVYDLSDEKNPKFIQSIELEKLGPFTAKVNIDGDKVRLIAIDDANGNDSCDAGEQSEKMDATITDDEAKVSLRVVKGACPALPE